MRQRIHLSSLSLRLISLAAVLVLWVVAFGCSKQPAETLTVVYSNDLNGTIRSCGCPAKDFGGLGRRATFLEIVRDTTKNFLLLDAGDFFGREINYGIEKADVTMKSMELMGYHGVTVGEKDFGFGVDYIVERTGEIGLPVLAANVFGAGADEPLFPPSWVVEYPSGLVVALIGVVGRQLKFPPQVEKGSLDIRDPISAVKREVAGFGDEVDLVVVIAHMFRKDAEGIALAVPEVDLIVCGHEGRPSRKNRRVGSAFLLQVPKEGTHAGVAFAVLDGDGGIRRISTATTPLSKEFEDHETIARLFSAYDLNVAAKEKSNLPPGMLEARARLNKPFPGSEACRECHEAEYAVWKASGHAGAFETLAKQSREFDKDCIPCHTTGFYKRGGFEHLVVSPELVDVGCESCHGNGHDHVRDADVGFDGRPRAVCVECHDDQQDPDFEFDADWERIRH